MSDQSGSEGISLKGFTSASHGGEVSSYISALESFDRLEQMQELKALGHAPASRPVLACSMWDAALDRKHCACLAA